MKYGSFNFCNLPPWVIASHHFNENPQPVEIQGVRASNRFLFEKLAELPSRQERALLFNDFMSVKFHLHHWQEQATDSARNSIRNSYLRFLKGWKIDSNSVYGAVLKHWVESRIGISPTFHRARIDDINSETYFNYTCDVLKGSSQTSAIQTQLDILFEFGQFELPRKYPGLNAITLYRGTHDAEEYDILKRLNKWEKIVRMNNLVSFTSNQERAWEFGRTVWKTSVPLAKIFFYNDLLPGSILRGEDEYVIIGGEYHVQRII
ncbi:MAG: NAD(+)--dinitrogen-reductase ADP-D-ribosyltransferase [Geobacteraceae bacterium]|nr:NAD(+)--dinitrogen-reductase ADP-D-ribosyltransferase [Geobacteraceae bacterium]